MKTRAWILGLALAASLTAFGCGHKRVSTSELQESFKGSETNLQALVDKTVSAIQSNNYPEALNNLNALAHKAKETPDQQAAVQDTIAAVQKRMAELKVQPSPPPSGPAPATNANAGFMKKLLGH